MIRTNSTLVGEIIELDPTIGLTPFIAVASALVDDIATYTSTHPPDLGSARLTLIETWLAAHFYCMRDPRPVSEAAGSVSTTYQSKIDLRLFLSHYGQMAATLDTSGYLLTLQESKGKRTASVTWLGTKPTT